MNIRVRLSRIVSFIRRSEEAQGLAEYALILALIAMVAIIGLVFLGTRLSDELSAIGNSVDSVTP